MFLFLAGHSHSVAFYFFRKKAPEQSHSRKLLQVVALCSIFIFSLVSQKKKKAPNRLLDFTTPWGRENTDMEGVVRHEYTVDTSYVDFKLLFIGGIVWNPPPPSVKCGTFILSADRCT